MNAPNDFFSRLERLGIDPAAISERFSRSSGPGGQHVNKVETQVQLFHEPTGVSASASEHRSRLKNRLLAWERLVEKFEALRAARVQERAALRSRKRAQAARRSPSTKRRMVEGKRRRGEIKNLRKKVQ